MRRWKENYPGKSISTYDVFIQLCKEVGLKVHLRIGPYCNAEIKNGGLPDWIIGNPNFRTRSNDPLYLNYVRHWYEAIYKASERTSV